MGATTLPPEVTLQEHRQAEGLDADVPIVLSDGVPYDPDLDRFFLDLPLSGIRSRHSLRAYGYDVVVWARFLAEARGKTVWAADRDDVAAFHRARRRGDADTRITAASWNRSVASLDRLYRWAERERLVDEVPFTHRAVWHRGVGGGRLRRTGRNEAYEQGARRSDMRFVGLEDYGVFRDVGLRGRAPDGLARPGARDRNGTRNALFANLLITTGLRLEETSCLLAHEIATLERAEGERQVWFRVPSGLAKGGRGRQVLIPARLLRLLLAYVAVERRSACAKFAARGGWAATDRPIFVRAPTPGRRLTLQDGGSVCADVLTPDERARLIVCGGDGTPREAAALWLTEVGQPVRPNSWEAVFARASRRCADAGHPLRVSPHELRHSFAVHMLAMLVQQAACGGGTFGRRGGGLPPASRRSAPAGSASPRPCQPDDDLDLSRPCRLLHRHGRHRDRGSACPPAERGPAVTVRPRRGRRVRFAAGDGAAREALDGVAGLRFTLEARHGGTVLVDLVDLQPRPLALAFAAALRCQAGFGGPLGAASSIRQHVRAYRRFFDCLRAQDPAVRRACDLRAGHIDGFEATLVAAGHTAIYRHTTLSKPINALRVIAREGTSSLDAELRDRLAYTSARPLGRSRPRDAYSPFVARQLRDAARVDVEALLRRIGGPLDERGDDHHRRALHEVDAVIRERGRATARHRACVSLYHLRAHRGLPVSSLMADLHGRHHLLATDLPPLLTLLSLDTGLEIECLKALTIDCLRNASAGTVEIAYVKRRARGAEHKTIRVRDGGIGTPGGLVRRLIELTAAARRHVGGDGLWAHWSRGTLRGGVGHPRATLDAWTTRHGILDDDGKPLRLLLSRLRKTHKALWYLKTEGHMARFAVGHTREVAARHYADLPSLRPLHEATAAAAFSEAAGAAAPVVLPPAAEAAWRAAPETAGRVAPDDVPMLLNGDRDVWLAACAGFYDSPHGEAGAPCPQPFWGCLECGNAVITERKLPAILAFLSFIEAERSGLAAADWDLKFGRAHARITRQVLPAFPEAAIAEARRVARTQALYLPPEARA